MQKFITTIPEFNNLKFTGDIRVEAVTEVPDGPYCRRILIMGPTGSGKSSFIEALAEDSQMLSISKDQLDGYTQQVAAYQLVNVNFDEHPVYLIDTPGFSDTKISEIEILEMVRRWMSEKGRYHVDRVLYLTPITETRLPGSKRRTVDMLKSFLGPGNGTATIIFVTTMWDTLHSDQIRRRAQSNFAQLRDEIFKGPIDNRADIAQFVNTKHSALQILDMSKGFASTHLFSNDRASSFHQIHQDLHDRISSALQHKKFIESDLAQPESHTNLELKAILQNSARENQETLTKFIDQFANVREDDLREVPPGFRRAAQGLRKRIAEECIPVDSRQHRIFQSWAQEPEISESDEPTLPGISDSIASSHPHRKERSAGTVRSPAVRMLALKGIVRRLIYVAKHRGSKWFKRRA